MTALKAPQKSEPDDVGVAATRVTPEPISTRQIEAHQKVVNQTDAGTERLMCLRCNNILEQAQDYQADSFTPRVIGCIPCGDDYLGPQLTPHRPLRVGAVIPNFHPPLKVKTRATRYLHALQDLFCRPSDEHVRGADCLVLPAMLWPQVAGREIHLQRQPSRGQIVMNTHKTHSEKHDRILASTRGTDTKYVATQDHEWTPDEVNAVYLLPDKALGAEPGKPLTLAEFTVLPDFMAKHPDFPGPEQRVKLAPVEVRFESSHSCTDTTLTESRLELHEVAGREGERIHFRAVLKRKG